jgi:putative transposase
MTLNTQEIEMPRKTFSPEQIIAKLRQIEVLTGQGQPVAQAVRAAGISEQSYYRWRKEYGGLRLESDKRRKNLEKINQRLKKLLAELFLDKAVLEVVVKGRLLSPELRAVSPYERQYHSLSTTT